MFVQILGNNLYLRGMAESLPKPVVQNEDSSDNLMKFTILNHPETIYSVEPREYIQLCVTLGEIYKVSRYNRFYPENSHFDYALRQNIGGENFIFRIIESHMYGSGMYTLDYISEEYGYALMEFDQEEVTSLEQTLISFIHTVFQADTNIKQIRFRAAPSAYTRSDIEEARERLKSVAVAESRDIDKMKPNELKSLLYQYKIRDTRLQNVTEDFSEKRERVFIYRLKKLFAKYGLPYTVLDKQDIGHDPLIVRTDNAI